VWAEITVAENKNLLIGNHYFAPGSDVKITENNLNLLEQNLNTHQYRVIIFGDFNVPK
jgi:endonuclease/exonuclease/phosphatase (EEP) superfamily protein YafD